MNERIQLILKTKNISASKFADEIGVQRSSISHIISGRNNPSLDFIQKIIKRFPDISSDWLIFGKGGMYKDQDLFSASETNKSEKNKFDIQISDLQNDIFKDNTDEIPVNQAEKTDHIKSDTETISETKIKPKINTEKVRDINKIPTESKNPEKKIERIIIFYSDKSCTEYRIEQNN